MPLNLNVSDGDFTPFLKYNAKAGRWYIRVDGTDGDTEVINPVLAFDFANIKTGWLYYMEGIGPEKVWDPSPGVTAPKPADPKKKFKRGFEVIVHGGGQIGLREFSATAGSMITPILEMYAIYEAGMAANPGKAPVFACVGVKPIAGAHGTNYSPQFKLQKWVDRSIFDNGDKSHSAPSKPPAELWSMEQCKSECARVGIAYPELVAELKARGETAFNAARATPIVRDLIARKTAPPEDNGFEIDNGPPMSDEIPF